MGCRCRSGRLPVALVRVELKVVVLPVESTVRFQFFPRSRRCPSHMLGVVDAFRAIEPELAAFYARWTPGTLERLASNTVLALVADELVAAGFKVERLGGAAARINVPVLWSENAAIAKYFSADALYEAADGSQTVVEIEAGGAVANNAWRKDFMEACLMPYVDHLVIAVRNEYRSTDKKKGTARVNQDYRAVCSELSAIYASEHWRLPLSGVMVLGY